MSAVPLETTEAYSLRRTRLRDCTKLKIPAAIYQNLGGPGHSTLQLLPQEVLLNIKRFLTFKSRCCAALASKFLGNIILEKSTEDPSKREVYNDGRKLFVVHLPPNSLPTQPRMPAGLAPPTQKMTHVCGEYRELLRVLARDWNSTAIRLCEFCRAWRPLGDEYWTGKGRDEPLDVLPRLQAWTLGGSTRCPQCVYDYRFLVFDIDGVRSITR